MYRSVASHRLSTLNRRAARSLPAPLVVLFLAMALGLGSGPRAQAQNPPEATAELEWLSAHLGMTPVIVRPKAGSYTLTKAQSLTAARIRGVELQATPPALGTPPAYAPEYDDGTANPPYQSADLRNFRFKYFNNEFNYTGFHLFAMEDYSVVHGFNIVDPRTSRQPHEPDRANPLLITHFPAGTKFLNWTGWLWEPTWMPAHGIDTNPARWDKMYDYSEADLATAATSGYFGSNLLRDTTGSAWDYCMADTENSPVDTPAQLRTESWYPKTATAAVRAAFENKYYQGYARSLTAMARACRNLGFKGISVYGYQPWYPIGVSPTHDPATDWAWNAYGKQITASVDYLIPCVYCWDWDPWCMGYNHWTNIAFTVWTNEENVEYVNSLPVTRRKPVRPYYMHTLMNRGGWIWWQNMAMTTEEARAHACLGLWTGIDGEDWWNYNPWGVNNNLPPAVASAVSSQGYCDVMLKDGFTATLQGTGTARAFIRYDALHVTAVDASSGLATFQFIEKDDRPGNWGVGAGKPYYTAPLVDLSAHLRTLNDDWPGIYEGLAMAKPFEYMLKYGQIMKDQARVNVYYNMLPVECHVRLGDIDLLATYDPLAVLRPGMTPRTVALKNFDGITGLNVKLPADSQVRIWVVRRIP